MIRSLARLALAAVAVSPAAAFAEVECGYLYGTRQTSARLAKEGWEFKDVVRIAFDRKEYQNISKADAETILRVVEEAFQAPNAQSSPILQECMKREEAAQRAARDRAAGRPPSAAQ